MDIEKRELWDSLDSEPSRAYEAFQTYLSLPSGDRTLVAAYRHYVDNPNALKASDTWVAWAHRYAWKDRAKAYDSHIDRIRRKGMEEAIEQAAAEQARQAERARYHLNDLLTNYHAKTMDFLEQMDPADMRFSDAVQVARLHIEHVDKFGSGEEGVREDDWTEEDDAELDEIWEKIQVRKDAEEGAQGPDEQDSESDGSNEDKEDSENPKNNPD